MNQMRSGNKDPSCVHRSDIDKIEAQWQRLLRLFRREQWSAAVVRAAIVAELAASYGIRNELLTRGVSHVPTQHVILRAAHGLSGKMYLLLPMVERDKTKTAQLQRLARFVSVIIDRRDAVIHRADVADQGEARDAVAACHRFVQGTVRIWMKDFDLRDPDVLDDSERVRRRGPLRA